MTPARATDPDAPFTASGAFTTFKASPATMPRPGVALIAGLGNPGGRYAATRHNVGFRFVERLEASLGFQLAAEKRFHAALGGVSINGRMVRVMTPDVWMNLSGQAVAPVAAFYRIPAEQILIVHDELDLAPGCARLKACGGHGGHNGLRDVIARLGSRDFLRLRIGIGHPGPNRDVAAWVLNKPSEADRVLIEGAVERSLDVLDDVVAGNLEAAMNRLHGAPESGAGGARQKA